MSKRIEAVLELAHKLSHVEGAYDSCIRRVEEGMRKNASLAVTTELIALHDILLEAKKIAVGKIKGEKQ